LIIDFSEWTSIAIIDVNSVAVNRISVLAHWCWPISCDWSWASICWQS